MSYERKSEQNTYVPSYTTMYVQKIGRATGPQRLRLKGGIHHYQAVFEQAPPPFFLCVFAWPSITQSARRGEERVYPTS